MVAGRRITRSLIGSHTRSARQLPPSESCADSDSESRNLVEEGTAGDVLLL
jgi:hypothetical protein